MLLLALIWTAEAQESMRFCSYDYGDPRPSRDLVVGRIEGGGWATVVSPDGYAIGSSIGLDDRSQVQIVLDGVSQRARIVEIDDHIALFQLEARPRCLEAAVKARDDSPVYTLDEDGEWMEGAVDRDASPPFAFPYEPAPGAPLLNSERLVGFTTETGLPLKFTTAYEMRLGFTWEWIAATDNDDRDIRWYGLGLVLMAGLGGFVVIRAGGVPSFDKNIRGTRSEEGRPCPAFWRDHAESWGLEVDGSALVGSVEGHPVRCTYDGADTVVHVRCDPPHELQAVHKDRAGSIRQPLDLDNPVADSLIAVGGEPEAIPLFDDEAFLGAVLEVVHGKPGSTIDGEGVTIRAGGLWKVELPRLIEAGVRLAKQLTRERP